MKKYALLAGLCLIICMSSCEKDELIIDLELNESDNLKFKNDEDRDHHEKDWNKQQSGLLPKNR